MKCKTGHGFLRLLSVYPESHFVIHGIHFSSYCLPNNSHFKNFPLCHVINHAVGQISLLQISLQLTDTVASISICFKILLSLFHCEFSYLSVGLLFQYNDLRKENERLLMKKIVKKNQELPYLNFVGN